MQHARVREFKTKKQQKVEEESSEEEVTTSSSDESSEEEQPQQQQQRRGGRQKREERPQVRSVDNIKFYSSEIPVEKKAKKEMHFVEYTHTEEKAMQRKEYKQLKNKKPKGKNPHKGDKRVERFDDDY